MLSPIFKSVDDTIVRRCVTTKLEFDQHCSEESKQMAALIIKSMSGKDAKISCNPCTADGCNGASQ